MNNLSKKILSLLVALSSIVLFEQIFFANANVLPLQNGLDQNQESEHISITLDKKNIAILEKTEDMFYAINDIWYDSFHYTYGQELEVGTYINSYLKNTFMKYDTFVYIYEGKAISMLMLIPTSLRLTDGSSVDGYYVYAVGTKKEYRNNGITTLMLEYVDEYAKSQGKQYRILNPDLTKSWLPDFYAKRGYEKINFRQYYFLNQELEEQAGDAEPMICQDGLSEEDLYNCRKMNLEQKTGFVNWVVGDLRYIQKDYKLAYKNYHELYFGDWQYAVVRFGKPESKFVVIKEFYIKDENKKAFFKTLITLFPDRFFIFETPDSDEFTDFFKENSSSEVSYTVKLLSMINFKGFEEDLKSKVKFPMYFNFGMD